MDRLDNRNDFTDILKAKFKHIYSIENIPQIIFESIDYLKSKLN